MGKKYQVFVSSTYEDLIPERKQVMKALLQMDCFPVGMEYFNAADESQWEIIKKLIDECDYYVLIVAGMYGTIDEKEHKSYTQEEYEYAYQKGIPTIVFVRKDLENIPNKFVEKGEEKKKMLEAFKSVVEKKLCKFWNDPGELVAQVILSLNSLIKSKPRTGWVRSDELPANAYRKILKLKEDNEKLEEQVVLSENENPNDIDGLQQGDDKIKLKFDYNKSSPFMDDCTFSGEINLTWNQIISFIAPYLIDECSESRMKNVLNKNIQNLLINQGNYEGDDLSLHDSCFQIVKVQLLALHIIELSNKKHGAEVQCDVCWHLTKYGNRQMIKLNALKRNS
ncbi:MAG: DUF4062 domain-containing protein [Prevotella sp.]|jgi:nucleoside 2-deoxyribosyltransferase|nr:DUF4062 domain-containing protein [Prevotella sp.]MCH3992109.1 DUF4062 domain-containing protein [Prevotella sp.]MCI1548499.1 DUF4062 domain-containing protein [Prevotella sp.]MCI1684973.1 DUF4062 domain-containing protein [Prevotella sp.]MCI1781860.1 DUF4062 domain-containing protein [Prevotella sp.]MCI1802861.1 DUF4062 domain-containing protein [Prevotella sp.]